MIRCGRRASSSSRSSRRTPSCTKPKIVPRPPKLAPSVRSSRRAIWTRRTRSRSTTIRRAHQHVSGLRDRRRVVCFPITESAVLCHVDRRLRTDRSGVHRYREAAEEAKRREQESGTGARRHGACKSKSSANRNRTIERPRGKRHSLVVANADAASKRACSNACGSGEAAALGSLDHHSAERAVPAYSLPRHSFPAAVSLSSQLAVWCTQSHALLVKSHTNVKYSARRPVCNRHAAGCTATSRGYSPCPARSMQTVCSYGCGLACLGGRALGLCRTAHTVYHPPTGDFSRTSTGASS
jgi:hypothetical protein